MTARTSKSAKSAIPAAAIAAALEGSSEVTFNENVPSTKAALIVVSQQVEVAGRKLFFIAGPTGMFKVGVTAVAGAKYLQELNDTSMVYAILNAITDAYTGSAGYVELGLHLRMSLADLATVGVFENVGYVKGGYDTRKISGINNVPEGAWASVSYKAGSLYVGKVLEHHTAEEGKYLADWEQHENGAINKHTAIDLLFLGYGFTLVPHAKSTEKVDSKTTVARQLQARYETLCLAPADAKLRVQELVAKKITSHGVRKEHAIAAKTGVVATVAEVKLASGEVIDPASLYGKRVQLWMGSIPVLTQIFDACTAAYCKKHGLTVTAL